MDFKWRSFSVGNCANLSTRGYACLSNEQSLKDTLKKKKKKCGSECFKWSRLVDEGSEAGGASVAASQSS